MPFEWTSLIGPAIGAAASLLGEEETRDANTQAAAAAADTSAKNIATIQAANKEAAATLAPVSRYAAPGLEYMTRVSTADPYTLSPKQQIELQDRRLQVQRGIPKGLRGSGRFVTAAVNDVENRGKANMIAENQARADQAARSLASTGVGATTSQASIQAGQGPQIAAQNTMAGDALGNATTANGQNSADTWGAIGSFFANAVKDQNRDTRYNSYRQSFA